jgi:glycosyltransferase involved in cell wall biosynthesis
MSDRAGRSDGADRARSERADVLIVSLSSTTGLRIADEQLAASLERAGARVALARARAPRPVRTLMLTDLAWARAARAAALRALAMRPRASPPGVIYSSTTAALLGPVRGAIRFDALAAANRRGRAGLWQRPLERRRVLDATLLLPWSEASLDGFASALTGEVLVLPVAVEPSGERAAGERDIAVLTYAANPHKKGLDRVLEAWRQARASSPALAGEELVIAGVSEQELRRGGWLAGGADGIRIAGALAPSAYRALLRRARVFACAPRREDYGIAQLEALADGCMLVTTPAPGPYAALAIACSLDPRLVAGELAGSIRSALERPSPDYAARARDALVPFSRAAVDRAVAEQLLPRLREGARLA